MTTAVKTPPQEETRLTISPEIVKKLIHDHIQNYQRCEQLKTIFTYDGIERDELSLNWIIADIFGLDGDYGLEEHYALDSPRNVLFSKFLDTISCEKIDFLEEVGKINYYRNSIVDVIYNKLLDLQKEYFEAVKKEGP